MIVAAACRRDGKIYSLPPPNRHHHIIWHMVDSCGCKPPVNGEFGFLDSEGNFVTRHEAWIIARKARQPFREYTHTGEVTKHVDFPIKDRELFSEDLW